MHSDAIAARRYRERLLADPHRPGYHFAIPEGNGIPGDPNGAFFADGRYHLMYLYEHDETGGFHWGHLSSTDLLHWRSHPDALAVENGDRGCFSGGAFVDDDQTAYLTFWKFPAKDGSDAGGIDIAFSRPPYERWPSKARRTSGVQWKSEENTLAAPIRAISGSAMDSIIFRPAVCACSTPMDAKRTPKRNTAATGRICSGRGI